MEVYTDEAQIALKELEDKLVDEKINPPPPAEEEE